MPKPRGTLSPQLVIALLAGLASVIYVTGGVVLALRLLFAGLPLTYAAGLPREFLFSVGASEVLIPAICVGVVAGVLELGQQHKGIERGHLPWSMALRHERLRETYLVFYAFAAFVLIAPGLGFAISTDDDIGDNGLALWLLGAAAAVCVGVWLGLARLSRIDQTRPPGWQMFDELDDDSERKKVERYARWAVVGGGSIPVVFAGGLYVFEGEARYFGVIGAWLVGQLFVLLVVWLRSLVKRQYQLDLQAAPAGGGPAASASHHDGVRGDRPRAMLIMGSWAATALLAVPLFLAVAAARVLPEATVCSETKDGNVYVRGLFVGETNDRIYIGDPTHDRILSLPSSKAFEAVGGNTATEFAPKRYSRGSDQRVTRPVVTTDVTEARCYV